MLRSHKVQDQAQQSQGLGWKAKTSGCKVKDLGFKAKAKNFGLNATAWSSIL